MDINKEERKKMWTDLGVKVVYQKLRTQMGAEAKSSNKMTDLWGPETLYLWTGRAFISSSVIDGVVGPSSASSALNVS